MKKFFGGVLAVLTMLALLGAASIIMPIGGGTGLSSPTANQIMYTNGAAAFGLISGTTGQCVEFVTSSPPISTTCPISGGTTGGGFAWSGSQTDSAITADGSTTIRCLGVAGTHFTIASSYLMVTDCNATTFVVNDGVTIFTVGHRIFASTSITVGGGSSGTIRNNGQLAATGGNASGATAGSAGGAGAMDQSAWGGLPTGCLWSGLATCGTSVPAGVIGITATTGNGGQGTTSIGNGVATGDICSASTTGVNGTQGGSGGNAGGGVHSGGGGGTVHAQASCTTNNPAAYAQLSLPFALTWIGMTGGNNNTMGYIPTNVGSSSGGAGGGDNTSAGGGSGGSGGNGGNGNLVILSSPTITVNTGAVISSDGANGGNGGNGANGVGGNAGGGGAGAGGQGGNGGVIVLVYHALTNGGSIHASAGTHGNHGTHGNGAGTGSAGTDGNNGNDGLAGLVLQIPQ
jgi:hypothetical protein